MSKFNYSKSIGLPLGALLVIALMTATPAAAYVGPGAGLTLIGSLVAVVAAVLIALVGLVLFPLRMLMKKLNAAKAAQQGSSEA